ncbi:ArsR family transcriptional regulator [Heyndrickxia shackletonii]|uniref:ArsR family transcriptional regulator n=1 Tax=Heyndrickxia shackletonii TaxID=157838 RepID=A0A0Q3WP53_9BACI|nr:metalloregulator ArsR/SmtB family transcription factor [Heyndrickxia shackletonii]KQL52451.1 ArsR family transcriptional regulator [Heyndrickxia shackletonii]NEY98984.1 metalloregulator ArsR/SmtB family transcription factor [Heyndrickxia shackletonii]
MQLNKIVEFHKALGDLTRIRIIALLQQGPLHGQAIAGKLGLKPPTITHHIAKLREVGLIKERRDKNTIYFSLNTKILETSAKAILTVGTGGVSNMEMSVTEEERAAIINNFFTKGGKLKNYPAQRKKKLVVLAHMAKGLEFGKVYPEKEINEYLKQFHEDYATLRRELIMCQYMYRENNQYELNPVELWWLH